jgi:hypothetical protein
MSERDPGASARPSEAADDRSIFELAAHLGAVGAVILTAFALLKCYAVAHFSLTTGSALLTTAPLSVLLGSLMSYAYWTLPLASLALLSLVIQKERSWGGETAALAGGAVLTALLSPMKPLIWCVAALAAFVIVSKLLDLVAGQEASTRRRHWSGRAAWTFRRSIMTVPTFFLIAVLWMLLSAITRPWIPVEVVRIDDAGEQKLIVGNVLSTDDQWTTIMRADDRGLSRLRSDDVLARRLCHLTDQQSPGQAPMLWEIMGRPYASPNRSCQRLVDRQSGLHLVEGSLPEH